MIPLGLLGAATPRAVGGGGGGDPYFANVSALLHFDGANGSASFTDVTGKTWTPSGDAQLTTTDPLFGTAALLLDGTGDYVTCASHSDFAFGLGDFTIEAWAKEAAGAEASTVYVFSFGPHWIVYLAGSSIYFNITGTNYIIGAASARGTYQHIALTREGSDVRLFYNGVSQGLSGQGANIAAADFDLGRYPGDGGLRFNGRFDELRITKGVARYTANFTPPTAAFPDS